MATQEVTMSKRKLLFLSLLLMLPLLAGCLEIEERVSIAPDGVSTLDFKMRLAIPGEQKKGQAEEARSKLGDVGSGVDGVEVVDFGITDQYGQMVLNIDLKADSFSALQNAYATFPKEKKKGKKPEPGDEIEKVFSKEGFYTIKKKGNKLVVERKIGTARKKKKAKGEEKDVEMLMAMVGGIMLRFDLKVPSKVISSNAEEVDGDTLRWVIPLHYLEENRVTLRAEIESTPELAKALLKK